MRTSSANHQDQPASQSEVFKHQATSNARNQLTEHVVASEFEVIELLEGLLEGFRESGAGQQFGKQAAPLNCIVPHGTPVAHEPMATGPPLCKQFTATRQPVMPTGPHQPVQVATEPPSWIPPMPEVTQPQPWRPELPRGETTSPASPQQAQALI